MRIEEMWLLILHQFERQHLTNFHFALCFVVDYTLRSREVSMCSMRRPSLTRVEIGSLKNIFRNVQFTGKIFCGKIT
jgi:hypothetical protein